MNTNNPDIPNPSIPQPNPALRKLDRLVGKWSCRGVDNVGSEITGEEKYEWMEGGFFLKQEIEQRYAGMVIKSIQIIGFFREWGDDVPSKNCSSHLFDNMGNSWEYIWEFDDDRITIWTGYIGSPAAYHGEFSSDNNTLIGQWTWPGGGYESTLTRIHRI